MAPNLFPPRGKVKQRKMPSGAGKYTAPVDTAGMDPEMKSTLLEMRGPMGAGKAASRPGPLENFMKSVRGMFKGK